MDTGINDRAAAADPYRTSDLAVHWLALEELAAPHQAQARTAVLRALAEEVDDVPGAEQATEALLWHLQSPKGLAVLAETAPDVLAAARQRLDDEALREAMQDDLAQAEVALGDAPPGAYQEVAAVKALEARFEPPGPGLRERLAEAREALVEAAGSPAARQAMSAAMLGVAAASGTLPLSLGMKASRLVMQRLAQTPRWQAMTESLTDTARQVVAARRLKGPAREAAAEEKKHPRLRTLGVAAMGAAAAVMVMADDPVAGLAQLKSSAVALTDALGAAAADQVTEAVGRAAEDPRITDSFRTAHFPAPAGGLDLAEVAPSPAPPDPSAPALDSEPAVAPEPERGREPAVAPEPETTTYTLAEGETLWELAARHYQAAHGEPASTLQIAEMVNGLGLADPNHVPAGLEVTFPTRPAPAEVLSRTDWLIDPPAPEADYQANNELYAGAFAHTDTGAPPSSLAWDEARWGPEPPTPDWSRFDTPEEAPAPAPGRGPAPGNG